MSQPMLEVDGLATLRGRVQVLWDVNVRVERGETVAIVGPNGAGKSTLIGSITGLFAPKSGRIRINGTDVTGFSPERLARHGIALVPERRQVYAPLTVVQNLTLGAHSRRTSRAEIARDLDDVFALFPGLVRYRETLAGSLSGGEQQMVAIGRALMAKPDLLLLDEPSLGLAPKVRGENFAALARLAERGVTLLLVEQNVRMAAKICGRAYLMSRGRITGTTTARELAASARESFLEPHV